MTHIRIIIKTTILNVSIHAGLAPNRGFLLEQVRQSAPYWPTRLVILCRILSNLRQDASSREEVMEEVEEVHNMQNLQQLCGALRGRGERVRAPPGVLTFICVVFIYFFQFKCLNKRK